MYYSSAYLLVFHGSRDPRPQAAVDDLADRFAQKIRYAKWQDLIRRSEHRLIADNGPFAAIDQRLTTDLPIRDQFFVGTACLECGELPLHKQIEQFSTSLRTAPVAEATADSADHTIHTALPETALQKLVVLPLFLLSGVHVEEDIPREIALAQQALGASVAITTRPAIGSHPKLDRLVTECMASQPVEARVLLAHGSRRAHANQPVVNLAERLGASTAYWSVPSSLEMRLQEFTQLGIRSVGILPYFLFAGTTTDAIAQTVETLSLQFPALNLHLAPPLSASSELTDLLVDLAQDEDNRLKAKS